MEYAQIPREVLDELAGLGVAPSELFAARLVGYCMEPEIHDGEVGVIAPMKEQPRGEICLFSYAGRAPQVARLTYNHVPGAMFDGEQMTARRNNGPCGFMDARKVEVLGRVAWHGFVETVVNS